MAVDGIKHFAGQISQLDSKLCDFHVHTIFSDGKDSPEICVKKALDRGMAAIGFSDHVWKTSLWLPEYIACINALKRKYSSRIRIYAGVEAKVISPEGELDFDQRFADDLDFVIGVVHNKTSRDPLADLLSTLEPDKAFEAEMAYAAKVVANPIVDIWGHPGRNFLKFFDDGWKDGFVPQILEVIRVARLSGTLVEINQRASNSHIIEMICRSEKIPFCRGSDAHRAEDIGIYDDK